MFEGTGRLEPVLAGMTFLTRWSPQGDSNPCVVAVTFSPMLTDCYAALLIFRRGAEERRDEQEQSLGDVTSRASLSPR